MDLSNVHILGQDKPKKLSEFEPLPKLAVDQILHSAEGMVAASVPLNAGVQIPMGTYCQLARTLDEYRKGLRRIQALCDDWPENFDADDLTAKMEKVMAVVELEPPPLVEPPTPANNPILKP